MLFIQAGRNGQAVSQADENKFKTAILIALSKSLQRKRLGNANPLWSNS